MSVSGRGYHEQGETDDQAIEIEMNTGWLKTWNGERHDSDCHSDSQACKGNKRQDLGRQRGGLQH